jgi:HEAT repeat protein
VDETKQRTMTGNLRDEGIREWLLTAAKDSDPGLRVESIAILKDEADATDVREALLATVQNDPNPGVRMKALEGLRRYSTDPETRKALSHVLLTDENPGIRTQAIDMLTQQRERDSVGLLQELVHKEDNPYVRQRCQRALRDMNASLETF